MKYVKGNILDARHGIICQQVNCKLVMGSGLAKAIRDKYPIVFEEYHRVMSSSPEASRLGKCQMVSVIPRELFVANLFGQFNYGRVSGMMYTDYNALAMALKSLNDWYTRVCHPEFPVFFPHGIGCGLGGGNWKTVEGMIGSIVPNAIIVRKT